jgi:crossover junction endodeoxyribonuclease RusA
MDTISLVLPYPPSANRYWRTDRRGFVFVSEEAKAYKIEVAKIASQHTLIYSQIVLTLKIFRPQRSGDLSNRIKVLEDALQGVTYANDGQIVEIHAFRLEDKLRPRVEVEITGTGLC